MNHTTEAVATVHTNLPAADATDERRGSGGAPARAIQELAGHQDLETTQRYMHLSPAAIEAAIRLLEDPNPRPVEDTPDGGSLERGEIVEAAGKQG